MLPNDVFLLLQDLDKLIWKNSQAEQWVLVIAHLVCKICFYLIENFKGSVSLIKVHRRKKSNVKKAAKVCVGDWRRRDRRNGRNIGKCWECVVSFQGSIFSGKFWRIRCKTFGLNDLIGPFQLYDSVIRANLSLLSLGSCSSAVIVVLCIVLHWDSVVTLKQKVL